MRKLLLLAGAMLFAGSAFALSMESYNRPEWLRLPDNVPMVERPWSNTNGKFSFVILGDRWSGGDGPENQATFDLAVSEINMLRPDFVITVGDMIPGHMRGRDQWNKEWAEYFQPAARLGMPLFLTVGNHDISNVEMYEWWKADRGRTYYSFNYNDAHFLVINTEEERVDGRGPVWEAQMQFIERDLADNVSAAHTFVFMHKPMWIDERYEADWARIEQALGDRPRSVIAGHWHRAQTQWRNGNLYAVFAGTGCGGRNPLLELGAFQHYTHVTVDGDSASYALIQPGKGLVSVDIPSRAFQDGLANIVSTESSGFEPASNGTATLGTLVHVVNTLPDSALITVRAIIPQGSSWTKTSGADSFSVNLGPGQRADRSYAFSGTTARLAPVPAFVWGADYQTESAAGRRPSAVRLFPDSLMRTIPEWLVIGVFDVGPFNTRLLPGNPEQALPGLFARREGRNFFDPRRTVIEGGNEYTWRKVAATASGYMNFNGYLGTKDQALAYAMCKVYSPVAQEVYAEFAADNYALVLLNGQLAGQKFSNPGSPGIAPLRLKKGWNTLVLKLVNNSGDWWMEFALSDPQRNLRFSVDGR
jgi:hypothetical protein